MTELRPVLLIHGLDDSDRVFQTMKTYLSDRGWPVSACSLVPSDGRLPLEKLAQQLATYVQDHFSPQQAFDLVGFSMGGLVSRYYVQRLGGIRRVHRLITISSPHRGTITGYFRWNPGCAQMRPNSPFLQDLNRDCQMLEQVQFVSLWTPLDLMIVPAQSSLLPVGESQAIPVALHPWMLTDERSLEAIAEILQR